MPQQHIARSYPRRSETSAELPATPLEVFDFLDDHHNLSAHMESGRSALMAGGQMELILDDQQGRALGSHVVMRGSAFGFKLSLDEIVTERVPGEKKTWETVEDQLIVIGPYRLGFTLAAQPVGSRLTVWIDYQLPHRHRWLGHLGGRLYASWCVRQILTAARSHFE